MKTLTAQADAARDRRYAEPIYLLELRLYRDQFGPTPVSTTLYLSDRARTELNQTWLPLVQSWGTVGDALDQLGPGGSIGALDVVLFNTKRIDTPTVSAARFSDLIRAGLNGGDQTYDIGFAEATLTLLFRGGQNGDQFALFGLRCEEVTDLTEATCVLRMTGRELSLEDAEDLYRVSTQDFPLCDPDDVGTPIPIAIGDVANAPAIGLVSGIVHKLAADVPVTPLASIPVSDGALVARMPPSGTLQIDLEQFTYTGRNITAMTFTGITRAAFGTTAVTHARGAPVFQVLSEYVYAFAANPGATHQTSAVPRLRSDGALIASGTYTIDLNNTTVKPGRRLVVARFPVKPIITKQIVLEVEDSIEVQDTIDVKDELLIKDEIQVGDNITASTPSSEELSMFPNVTLPRDSGSYQPQNNNTSGLIILGVTFGGLPSGGTVQTARSVISFEIYGTFTTTTAILGAGSYVRVQLGSVILFERNATQITWWPGTIYYPQGVSYFTGWNFTLHWILSPSSPYTIGLRVTSHEQIVRRTIPINKFGQAGRIGAAFRQQDVHKAGEAKKIGTVQLVGNTSAETVLGTITADLTGVTDTPTGTITAMTGGPGANALLTNPADVTYLLQREVFGETDVTRYRAASWAGARAALAATGVRWDFLYRGGTWSECRRLVGLQSRSDLFMEGGQYVLAYRQLTTPAQAFDARNLDGEPVFGWSPRTELVTTLTALYDPDLTTGTWQGSQELRSTRLTTRYGSRRRVDKRAPGGRDLSLPWVRAANTATVLANYWLGQWETPRMTCTLRGYWDALALEKSDVVTVGVPLVAAFGTVGFAIRSKRYRLGEGVVELEGVELDRLPSVRTLPASYALVGLITRALPAGYRQRLTWTLTPETAYRVRLPDGLLTLAGAYQVSQESSVSMAARYDVLFTGGSYDAGGVYDGTAVYDAV